MKLGELITVLGTETGMTDNQRELEVRDISQDSRKVKPGSLFVAVRGFHSDGHQFIPHAFRQGAAAVVAEKNHSFDEAGAIAAAPLIRVPDSRRALALLADAFYGHPSGWLKLVGVTGTNGKTTTTYLIKAIVEAAGRTAGLIGTIDYRVGDRIYPAPNTTPESLDLQRFLAEMVRLGAGYAVMEVSSHALELGRTVGCEFAAAAFTNLTQDHLDFHETMASYFQAKLRLFTGLAPDRAAVINIDDARAGDIMRSTGAKIITFGLSNNADIRPSGPISHGIGGLSFDAATPSGTISIESSLVGRHNVYNILTAVGIGTALGFGRDVIARGIKNMKSVPGRMEKIDEGQPFGVIVDYAHTEDALNRLLEAVGEVAKRRIITVFGCGGDRDRIKRPKMGAAAVKGSDVVIVTSDNPRTEDPLTIISEIEQGMTADGTRLERKDAAPGPVHGRTPYYVISDRHDAVEAAIAMARPGDVVVLAGKGHEDYQIIGTTKIPFDDRQVARQAIRKRQTNEDR